jgi:hypothetical protein
MPKPWPVANGRRPIIRAGLDNLAAAPRERGRAGQLAIFDNRSYLCSCAH